MNKIFITFISFFILFHARGENGYRLWLRYDKIDEPKLLARYQAAISGILFENENPKLKVAKKELIDGLQGLLDKKITLANSITNGTIICGTPRSSASIKSFFHEAQINELGDEGFIIRAAVLNKRKVIFIAAKNKIGVLYGAFNFLRRLQTHESIEGLSVESVPKIKLRLLNHWDNLNRTVERGYAGFSIWNWHTLPDYIDQRYIDYARANASIGINGTVLTNVNANSLVLTKEYLIKVKALADLFRPYGIKVYLTARFSSPIEIGKLKTADPLDTDVQNW
ncbi:MAG: alpha-glucuronidase family glycosyl hydrolase, partial [Ginsengibacter sp.]